MTSETLAAEKLAPVARWARSNHGAIQRLAAEMKRLSGENVDRSMVGRWLTDNPKRKQFPSFGHGLLLIRAFENLHETPTEKTT